MNVIGINQLQMNVSQLSYNLAHNEYTLITHKDKLLFLDAGEAEAIELAAMGAS